jgi:hypothetical protein
MGAATTEDDRERDALSRRRFLNEGRLLSLVRRCDWRRRRESETRVREKHV